MRGLVFVGPSLHARSVSIAGLELAPPAVRGDLLRAADRGARRIGLVDGELFQRATITPGEVRAVAARGVRIWGAASVGALRAVECPESMTGVGEVYVGFRDGSLIGDDEVALTYDPQTYAPVAYPLVNLRAAARIGAEAGWWTAAAAAAMIDLLRARPFYDRTLTAIAEAAARSSMSLERFRHALADPASDVKGRDAALLCRVVMTAASDP